MICSTVLAELYNPEANEKSIITCKDVRFTLLTPELIRLEWSENGQFENRASLVFVNRNLPEVSFSVIEKSGWLIIKTDKLTLRYKIGSGRFNAENLQISFILNNERVNWYWGKEDKYNLLGAVSSLDQVSDSRKVKLENGLISRGGWTLIDDSKTNLFDGNPEWNWVLERPQNNNIDAYLFCYGHNYSKAIYDFTQVAGKIPVPPRYVFGYWWSRYWSFSDMEIRKLIKEMKLNKIPMDVFILDMDWHMIDGLRNEFGPFDIMGQRKGWTGYQWNSDLFPQPDKLLSWMEMEGIKSAINIHPASGILKEDEPYRRMVKALNIDTTLREFPYSKAFAKYAGWDTVSVGKNLVWDITNKKFAKAYFNEVIRPFERQGVDFFWLDWQQWKNTPIKGLSNVWWINYCFFSDMENNSNKRPLMFHRWGGLGNHRYPIGFSGDTRSNWNMLEYEKYFTATGANVGYSYWSNDIGGHVITSEFSPELYTRWVQFGVFSPVLRTHATKKPDTERLFWKYPYEYFTAMRDAINLRYSLIPYIYSAARHTYDTGEAICLPMYYKHPENEEAYQYRGQYYFGQDMIAAPVSDSISKTNNLALAEIWLPKGKWFDWSTGTTLDGNKVFKRYYSLSQTPVFIKSGAIIPMYPFMDNTSKLPETLILSIFPGEKGSMTYYEDDGNSNDYIKEIYSTIIAEQETVDNTITVSIQEKSKNYISSVKNIRIDFNNTLPPRKVMMAEKDLKWEYNSENLITSVYVPDVMSVTSHIIKVSFDENLEDSYLMLNATKGKINALKEVILTLKEERARVDWGAISPIINSLYEMSSRISYDIATAKKEYLKFNDDFSKIISEIEKMHLSEERILAVTNRLKNEMNNNFK